MDDIEFLSELRQMMVRRGESANLVDTIAFVSEVAERLEEDPVFGEFILAEDSRRGAHNRQLKLHGFTELDDADGALSMVIGRWVDDETPSTLSTSDVDQMRSWLENFASEALQADLEERITESSPAYQLATTLRRRRNGISCIRLHIFSNQTLSRAYKREFRGEVAGTPTETHIWDLQRIKALYESAREREVLEIDLEEFGSKGIPCIDASSGEGLQSYLCVIEGNLLADLYERYGSRLLEGNVRSFLGMKGGVNKGIRATVQDSPELFFAYNNGIAATAADVSVENADDVRIVKLSDLQIVNGGQTTASILRARKQDKLNLGRVSVPMKLTVVSSTRTNDLVPKIAEYANTQNKVAIADFFANHPFHRKMEEISRRVMVPARAGERVQSKWFYERSRGQFQNERLYLTQAKKDAFDLAYPPRQVINKTDLAKYDSTLDERPHWVSLGAQKNFIKFATKFSAKGGRTEAEQWEALSPNYGDAYYQRIAAMAILWKAGEAIVSAARGAWYEGAYRPQIVSYGWALLFHALRRTGREPDLMKIWERQEADENLMRVFTRAAALAQKAILDPPVGSANVGEWSKKEECWEKVKAINFRLDASALLEWSIDKDESKSEVKQARQQGVQDDGISLQQQIWSKSENGYWQALLQWERVGEHVFGPELDLLRKAASPLTVAKLATERDWKRLRDIGERCESEGFRQN